MPVPRSAPPAGATRWSRGWLSMGRSYRKAIISGSWLIIGVWVTAAVAVTAFAPSSSGGGGGFGDLLPPDSEVLKVEERALAEFRVPVISGTSVVVHQPGGLSMLTRADSLLWALATTQDAIEADPPPPPGSLIAAIPVPTGRADTTVTYLYMTEGTGLRNTVRLAKAYAAHFNNQPQVSSYVTGFVPAQLAQGDYLRSRLRLFEVASVVLILLVVALAFRSLLAPLVVLAIAAVGYLVYFPLLDRLADAFGFEVPRQLEPVLLALLLGVVTDYCVLFFSALRDELDQGYGTEVGVENALKRNGSVIAVAGLTVAGGTISLLAAPFEIFRALGPALALTVLVGLAMCLTLTPAAMRILSWRLFTVLPVRGSQRSVVELGDAAQRQRLLTRGIRLLTRRGPALASTVVVVVLLGAATVPLIGARLDLSFTAGLPSDDSVSEGADLLKAAGIRGISAPTEVLVEQDGVTSQRAALADLEQQIAVQPGVVRVLGPADLPSERARGLVLAQSGNAARFIVVYNTDPLAAEAISNVKILQDRLPVLAGQAGLADARVSMTGQTLIAAEVAELTRRSLQITLVVALIVELIILALYLRAVIAPIVSAGLQCVECRCRPGAHHLGVPVHARRARADVLRPVLRGGVADRARLGLQRLLRRVDLGGDETASAGRGAGGRRAASLARHHHSRPDPGRHLRAGRDHPAIDLPADRLRHDGRATIRHSHHPTGAHPRRSHAARAGLELAQHQSEHRRLGV